MSADSEVVQGLIDAYARDDIDAALALLHPDVEVRPLRAQLEGTSYSGHDGYREMLAVFEEDWEGLRLIPDRLVEGDGVVVFIGHIAAKGRTSGVDLEAPLGIVFEIQDGLVTRFISFSDSDAALREAGLSA